MRKNYLLICLVGLLTALMSGCSDDDEPKAGVVGPEHEYEITDDVMKGKLFYYASLSDINKGRCRLDARELVDLEVHNPGDLQLSLVEKDGIQFIRSATPTEEMGNRIVVPAWVKGRYTGNVRNIIFIIDNDLTRTDEGEAVAEEETRADMTPEESLHSRYGSFLGKGTMCFGDLGNQRRDILVFDQLLRSTDPGLFQCNDNLTQVEFTELHETSFSSLMHSFGMNIGLSGKVKGVNVGFSYGYSSMKKESNDYEYLMLNCHVKRAEMKINIENLQRMATKNERTAAEFLSYVTPLFNEEVVETPNRILIPDVIYDRYGTDMMVQGILGGVYSMVFVREENIHESKIQHDFSAHAQHKEKEDTTGYKWYNYLREHSSDEDFKTNISITYQDQNYFKSSKAETRVLSRGGYATIKDPAKWVEAFNDRSKCDHWELIQYNVSSDGLQEALEDKWFLYNIDRVADNVVDAVEYLFTCYGKMSEADRLVIENARANAASLCTHRDDYLEKQIILDKEKSPLVICDVMMINEPERRKGGKPEIFVAPDPFDKTKMRTYYPMITNQYFDPKQGSKAMRGMPIDTNDDVFLASGHTTSHYWYVALAHRDDCNGIVDIKFATDGEAPSGYIKRGDHGSHGLSGLLPHKRYVYVRFGDSTTSPSNLITAFGLYDDHDDYKKKFPGDNETYRIFASSLGAEIPSVHTGQQIVAFHEFWKKGFMKGNKAFYSGGGAHPHSFYPVYSTQPLPLSELSKVNRPYPKWGEDRYYDEGSEE